MLTISKLAPQVGRTIGNKKNIKIRKLGFILDFLFKL